MPEIIEPELSYKITGLCFKIHSELGRFCRERQYSDKFEELLKLNNFNYKREFELKQLAPESPAGNKVDFLIENRIIIDFKSKIFITKEDYTQMQRYLQAAGIRLGLIINFHSFYLKPKRIINTKYSQSDLHHL